LSSDPSTFFGGLLRGCIRDRFSDEGSFLRESFILTVLGMGSGFLTVYALSLLRLFV
jgi:hypothetical protein